jgi:hypothetical protein
MRELQVGPRQVGGDLGRTAFSRLTIARALAILDDSLGM